MSKFDTSKTPIKLGKVSNIHIATDFSVVHEDDDLLILEKPAPLAVHPVGAYSELNLHSLLKKDPRWQDTDIRFAHRLDAETSGLIVATKTAEAARFMGIEFRDGRVTREYRALVKGMPPHPEGVIDIRLGTDSSSGFQTVRVRDDRAGEEARTRYRLVFTDGNYSLLEITPITGRTHQIRAHLSFLGTPIVGDKIYNELNVFREYVLFGMNEAMLQRLKLPRMALHATRLVFRHPRSKEYGEYRSTSPPFMTEVLKWHDLQRT